MLMQRTGPLILATFGLSLLLAACGGSDPAPTQQVLQSNGETNSVAPVVAQVATPVAQASETSVSTVTAPSAPAVASTIPVLSIEDLDPDTIVAAQEQVMIRLYENLLPSVVHIRVSQRLEGGGASPSIPRIPGLPLPEFPEDFFQRGEGSGFVWDEEGHVVTNNHVVLGAERVTVVFADRVEIEATVIGRDPDSDLAVLKLNESKPDARPVTLGDSDTLKVGQLAVAIGNPFGQQFTMTTGIVSALGRTITSSNSQFSIPEVVQTDAPINPGNSGGPLIDRRGRVIGVNTQIISRSGVSSGVGFAVPINTAKQVIPALISDGRYDYSWLGITGTTLRPEIADQMNLPRNTGGALVIQITGDSPADKSGLRGSDRSVTIDGLELPFGGDVIVAVDGSHIQDMSDLIAYLISNTRPQDKVLMDVIRDGEELVTLEVTLGTRPES